jgi:hypothetical protein
MSAARMPAVRMDVALQALNLYLSVGGAWMPIVRRREGERDRLAWRPAGRPGLEHLVRAWDERPDREILIGLPQARRWNQGVGQVGVLVARVEGTEQLARARRFRPLPSLVLAEGSSSRRWLLWALERPVGYFDAVERNRKIAYALRATQKWKDPDRVWLPAPGTCLRVDRARPVPVVCARLSTDTFAADAITARLKEPPALDAWRDAAAR